MDKLIYDSLKRNVEITVAICRIIYESALEVGFTELQAFSMAVSYLVKPRQSEQSNDCKECSCNQEKPSGGDKN